MIDVAVTGDLWRVTLNRPEKANSLTAAMLSELINVMERANGVAKVLVLTGTGKNFSAGADLTEAHAGLATSDLWEQLSGAVAALPCLTIAALNGNLAGGAFGMVLACDIRLAVPGAQFFYPVMKLGFLPRPSDPARLMELIGPGRSKMILMAGQRIATQEALDWGLVDRVVGSDAMAVEIDRLAADALAADASLIAGNKSLHR